MDGPVGGDADRLGGLHVRRRDAPSPREPSSLRHPGGCKRGSLSVGAGAGLPELVFLLLSAGSLLIFQAPTAANARECWRKVAPFGPNSPTNSGKHARRLTGVRTRQEGRRKPIVSVLA
ncbi:hypothetical protein AMECASPLE_012012 [Ameca splendens]|uniref:Uncharacterized protein n=1 Tax=Ameca splendens TaxID=208324 RepID=A0ABV0Y186_9TELE